jgi:hypothetical protein
VCCCLPTVSTRAHARLSSLAEPLSHPLSSF